MSVTSAFNVVHQFSEYTFDRGGLYSMFYFARGHDIGRVLALDLEV